MKSDQQSEPAKVAFYEVLDNQLETNDPPETREALRRLRASGTEEDEARRLIACVIAAEMFEVMQEGTPFDRRRFVQRLNDLPEMPWSEE